MGKLTDKLPDTLFGYILYFDGSVMRALSDRNTAESVWEAVFSARAKPRSIIKFWNPPNGGKYTDIWVDATKVIAVRTADEEISIAQPNLELQRRADQQRREAQHAAQRGGRVTIGQTAVPHGAGRKR